MNSLEVAKTLTSIYVLLQYLVESSSVVHYVPLINMSVNICLHLTAFCVLDTEVERSNRTLVHHFILSGGFIANFLIGGFSRTYGIVMEEFQKIFDCQSAYLTLAGGLIYCFMYAMCKLDLSILIAVKMNMRGSFLSKLDSDLFLSWDQIK